MGGTGQIIFNPVGIKHALDRFDYGCVNIRSICFELPELTLFRNVSER